MPRVSNIEILYKNDQPTISIRTRTNVQSLPMLIGEGYGKLAAYLKELGELLSDVPYVAYHNMDMNDLDVEIGFPVSKALPDRDNVKAGVIPAGKSVFCMFRGHYSEMEPTYEEMMKWLLDNGYTPLNTVYEHYYNGPEFPESEMLTMIVMPVG